MQSALKGHAVGNFLCASSQRREGKMWGMGRGEKGMQQESSFVQVHTGEKGRCGMGRGEKGGAVQLFGLCGSDLCPLQPKKGRRGQQMQSWLVLW